MKFGGTSVADINCIKKVAEKVANQFQENKKIVVVVSAMSGITNSLIDQVKKTSENFPYSEYDTVVSSGEHVTSALLSIALEALSKKHVLG